METMGERMRRVREAQGLTIYALAETCLVSEGAIRQVESGGVRSPSLLLGLRIAKALGVEPYWLATRGARADRGSAERPGSARGGLGARQSDGLTPLGRRRSCPHPKARYFGTP
jgi:transcriptional regulator with XRE-family HTH domain